MHVDHLHLPQVQLHHHLRPLLPLPPVVIKTGKVTTIAMMKTTIVDVNGMVEIVVEIM